MTTTIESKAFQAISKELERERQRCRELEIEIMALRAEIERLKSESRRVTPAAMVFDNIQKELADKDRQLAEARAEIERLRSRNKMLDTALAPCSVKAGAES